VGLIPYEIMDFFNLPNPSSRSVDLGLTQPLTKECKESFSRGGGKEWPARRANKLTAIWEPIV
jgi:hypothetical protein